MKRVQEAAKMQCDASVVAKLTACVEKAHPEPESQREREREVRVGCKWCASTAPSRGRGEEQLK